jgi:hypothetical protein
VSSDRLWRWSRSNPASPGVGTELLRTPFHGRRSRDWR